MASSLQPSVAPGTADVQAPLEAQGRGFTHGHGKGHSILGPTMRWLRRAIKTGFTSAVRLMREALLRAAGTTQYDAAREAGAVTLNYGLFVNAVISFAIVAFSVFLLVRQYNRLKAAEEAKPPAPAAPTKQETLLTEIRDLLKTGR